MTNVNNNVMIVESLATSPFTEVVNPKMTVPAGMMLVEGVLGVANVKNRNNRYYTLEEYKRHVDTFMERVNETNGVFGEMEHPKSMNINLHNVSHKIMDVRIDENDNVLGQLLLLDTPTGKIAQSVVRSGSPLPVSSRALGSVAKDGKTTLEHLSTWDLVGTSGFKQANVRQISESIEDEQSGMIVESIQIELNSDNSICENSTETALHASQIQEIVENYLATKNDLTSTVNESAIDDSILEQKMSQLFSSTWAPIIEDWLNTTFTSKLSEGLQTWLVESYGSSIQTWLVESYGSSIQTWMMESFTPELSSSIQTWMTESFTPELGNGLQTWLTEDYANENQNWLTETFAQKIGNGIQNWVTENKNDIFAGVTTTVQVTENVDDTQTAAKPSASTVFKSNILEALQIKQDAANAVVKPELVTEQVDEAMFKTGPVWLKNIPSNFKGTWTALNESQREQVYRRAAIRRFDSYSDIDVFWNAIDFRTIVESQLDPKSITRNINEGVEPKPAMKNAGIFALAKQLNG